MSKLLRAIYDYNLCTYYVLPLLKLSRDSFGPNNFIQCYVSDAYTIFIVLRIVPRFLTERSDYVAVAKGDGDFFACELRIDMQWADDVDKFSLGQYTKLSEPAKDMITDYSGLPVDAEDKKTNEVYSDFRILALGRDAREYENIRIRLGQELDADIPVGAEVISIPDEREFVRKIPR